MTNTPTIRTMTREDVDFAVRLAAREGWNPGLSDADCFHAADPDGFFISELNGEPIGTMSAVRYDDGFGFLGFYIMVPQARGKGYGMELWNHAVQHVDDCIVGLDAVTEQEATYKKSGFRPVYRSTRFEGRGGGSRPDAVTPLEKVDLAAVLDYDRACFPGEREEFMTAWLDAAGARGFAVMDGDRLAGFGVARPCVKGYKIGPLFADNGEAAEAIYQALKASIGPEQFYLDVIEPNKAAMKLVEREGLDEVFVTVRMYRGGEPEVDTDKVFGVTSFELG